MSEPMWFRLVGMNTMCVYSVNSCLNLRIPCIIIINHASKWTFSMIKNYEIHYTYLKVLFNQLAIWICCVFFLDFVSIRFRKKKQRINSKIVFVSSPHTLFLNRKINSHTNELRWEKYIRIIQNNKWKIMSEIAGESMCIKNASSI